MKTISQILELSSDYLSKFQVDSPRLSAEKLLAFLLGMKRVDLYMQFDRPLEEKELEVYRAFLKRKAQKEPIEYITGSVDFFGVHLKITKDVLIPRQETEILVSMIAKTLEQEDLSSKTAWDICTGSGAIGIALKKKFPSLHVEVSDISSSALLIAEGNAKQNEAAIQAHLGDLFAPFAGRKADFIFCNPPYVTEKEYLELAPEVRNFEPRSALVGGEDGLEFYRRLAKDLPQYLNSDGKAFLEIGHLQGGSIREIFSNFQVQVEKDWSGKDRFVILLLV